MRTVISDKLTRLQNSDDGLRRLEEADDSTSFSGQGCEGFVGWSDSVSADHTEASTQYLLEKRFTQDISVREAVDRTRGCIQRGIVIWPSILLITCDAVLKSAIFYYSLSLRLAISW